MFGVERSKRPEGRVKARGYDHLVQKLEVYAYSRPELKDKLAISLYYSQV